MSALGQKQTLAHVSVMSALPPKADIRERGIAVFTRGVMPTKHKISTKEKGNESGNRPTSREGTSLR
jgi:hypothetical protein